MNVFRADSVSGEAFAQIVALLRKGGIIAFPTDTAYGLGANPFDANAVNRIFAIKGRKETKPILLLVNAVAMAESLIEPSDTFYRLAETFWPGPLTIISRAAPYLPSNITAGTETVGVRWPMASFATTLINHFGGPLTGTSANQSGMPTAITVEDVYNQLGASVDALIDGGVLPSRGGSTVLDLTVDPPALLREGPVTFDSLAKFFDGRIRRQIA